MAAMDFAPTTRRPQLPRRTGSVFSLVKSADNLQRFWPASEDDRHPVSRMTPQRHDKARHWFPLIGVFVNRAREHFHPELGFRGHMGNVTPAMGVTAALRQTVERANRYRSIIVLIGKEGEDEKAVIAQGRRGGFKHRTQVGKMDQCRGTGHGVIM